MSEDGALLGEAAPPMANGELIFDEPWQSRVFGLARVLCERGHFDWDEFREKLIGAIAGWEATHGDDEPYRYYDLFFVALTQLMEEKSLCLDADVSARARELASRPHGHDH